MALAERARSRVKLAALPEIGDNEDLRKLAGSNGIRNVILFRAGVIVSERTISDLEVLNIHCAKLGRYGGLASIARALTDGALDQDATLHRITTRIDEGEVLDTEPYRLDSRLSYRENEDRAYEAGLVLLERTFDRSAVNATE